MILSSEKGTIKFGLIIVGMLVAIFGVWMGFAPLKSAAVATGQVGVMSNKKVIQHLEGGVVDKIYVKDGDVVKAGDVLIEIKNETLNSQTAITKSEYLLSSVLTSRLEAQKDEKDSVEFAADAREMEGFLEASASQLSIFEEQNKMLRDEIEILNQRISQLNSQIKGVQAIVNSKSQRVASLNSEKREWERLYAEQLTDKIRLRDIERELSMARGEIASGLADIAKLNVQITETKQQILLRERSFKEDTLKQYEIARARLNDATAKLRALSDQGDRALIKAPVDGTVVELTTHTLGGVVRSGEPIMSIIPINATYVVEAKLQVTDIDKVYVGLDADIRLSAFNSQNAMVMEGNVTYVSADALNDRRGEPYYEVKAELTERGMEHMRKNKFFLVPGMPVEVVVKTGERTMLSYLLKPFINMFQRAFNED